MHWHILHVKISPERVRRPGYSLTRYPAYTSARNALIDNLRTLVHEHDRTEVTSALAALVTDPDLTHVSADGHLYGVFGCEGDCEQMAYDHWSSMLDQIEKEIMD